MKKYNVRNPFVQTDEHGEIWEMPDGGENLPIVGARCLFEVRGGVLINGRPLMDGFRAYGYRADRETILLPLWGAKLPPAVIRRWRYVEGPPFWNGNLAPIQ